MFGMWRVLGASKLPPRILLDIRTPNVQMVFQSNYCSSSYSRHRPNCDANYRVPRRVLKPRGQVWFEFACAWLSTGIRRAMAFQSGTKGVRCYKCKTEGKFFKMYQSFRPEHIWEDESKKTMSTLFYIDCEVNTRKEEWEQWTKEQNVKAGENYPTKGAVIKDQKDRSRESWHLRSEFIQKARKTMKALKEKCSDDAIQVNQVNLYKRRVPKHPVLSGTLQPTPEPTTFFFFRSLSPLPH